MTKTSLSFMLAGVFAFAGAAHAQTQTWDAPQRAGEASTMTQGRPNLETNNIGWPHGQAVLPQTHVMGAGPTTTIVHGSPDTVVLVPHHPMVLDRKSASATFDVPARAGEVTTMTGGVPNMVTNNNRVILQQRHLYN